MKADFTHCERCGTRRNHVLASAFQRDGRAEFRFLCSSCERAEFPLNQPALFEGMRIEAPVTLFDVEPEPVRLEAAQLALF